MAATFIQQCANGTDATSSNVAPVTLTAGVSSGHTIVLIVAMDNASSTTPRVSSISTPAGETASWSMVTRQAAAATSSANTSVMLEAWRITTTQTWSNAFAATVFFDTGSIPKKAWVGLDFTGITGVRFASALAASGSYAQSDSVAASAELIVAASAWENNAAPSVDTDTTNGSWSTQYAAFTTGGGAASNVALGVQYKILTASGNQQFDATGANDGGGLYIAFSTAPTISGDAGLTQPSTLSAAGTQGWFAIATLSQASTLTADGTIGAPTYFGVAALLQASTLSVGPVVSVLAAASLAGASTLTCTALATAGFIYYSLPCTLVIRQHADVGVDPDGSGDAYFFSLVVAGLTTGGTVKLSVSAVSVNSATDVPYVVYCDDLPSYQTHYGYANPTSATTTFLLAGMQNGDTVSGYIQAHIYAWDVYGAIGEALTLTDVSLVYTTAPPLPGEMTILPGAPNPRFASYPLHTTGT